MQKEGLFTHSHKKGHDAVSFKFFWELAKSNAANAGIMVVSAFDYYEEEATKDQLNPWWETVVPTVRNQS